MAERFSNVEERMMSLMRGNKMSQIKLASLTGLSATAINSYCKGNRLPDTSSIFLIAKALNTTIEWLLTGEGEKNPQPKNSVSLWELQEYQRQAMKEYYDNLTVDQMLLLDNYGKLTLPNRVEVQAIISLKLTTQEMEGRAQAESGTA